MPQGWNETAVVLIPKVIEPERIKDPRPISLCNVVDKIASKVLASRLKNVLLEVISLKQSAFILGRLISGNILLAHEIVHHMKTKRRGRNNNAALKFDTSKAYDRPTTLLSWGPGPRPNLDSKPPLLSPGLSDVLRPPPSPPPISQSGKSRNPRQESNKPSLRTYPSMRSE